MKKWIFLLAFIPASLNAQTVEDLPTRGAIQLWPNENTENLAPRKFKTPTKKLAVDKYPDFSDDRDFDNMYVALERQLKRYRRFPVNGTIKFGDTNYELKHVTRTLEAFLSLSNVTKQCVALAETAEDNAAVDAEKKACYAEFNAEIRSSFDVYVPNLQPGDERYGEDKDTFFTAYYTPTLEASLTYGGDFKYGVYAKPRSDKLRRSTRVEIHFENKLVGKGLTLFYVKDLFELYLLHVQGGGRLVYEDRGQLRSQYIHYNGHNSQPFRFISHYMIEKGYIEDGRIETQRDYLKANPDKQREIYNYCPSYVYYKKGDTPATGSAGVSVTNGRSIATDWRLYRYKGLLAFVQAQQPTPDSTPEDVEFEPFQRFMLDQDTGGAIKGKGRVDLFQGEDDFAELAAFNTKHTGNLYYLMLKN